MSFTRKDLRQRIGGVEFCNDMIASSASANGTTTTLIDTSLKQADDFFNYAEIVPLEGNGANAPRYVTDWVQSTSTFTVDRVWGGATASADDYEVHRLFSYAEKNDAINAAIRASGDRWDRQLEDTTITLDTETYGYAVTGTIDQRLSIDDLKYDTGLTGTIYPYKRISNSFWEVRTSGTMSTLQFLTDLPTDADGNTLRISYRLRPAAFSDDTTILQPDDASFANYLCAKATAILFRGRALKEPESEWANKAVAMEQLAEGFYDLDRPRGKPKAVRSEMLSWGK